MATPGLTLKGEYEDYNMGEWAEPSRLSPFMTPLHLVPLIPYSAIAKTVLVRSLIFQIFTRVENQPLTQRLKQKRRIIVTNLQNIISFAKL